MKPVISLSSPLRRTMAGLLLVSVGLWLSPVAVPIYDGIGVPDEPYRFVATPEASPSTAPPTQAVVRSPIAGGVNSHGMNVATAEQGPQFSLFLPPKALAAAGGPIEVRAEPLAPAGQQPAGRLIDGNMYSVTLTSPQGTVTRTAAAAIATVYLRATSAKQPGPQLYYRPQESAAWQGLTTSRGGMDFYAASYAGPGQYALAFPPSATSNGPGIPVALLALGVVVLAFVVIVLIRLRSNAPGA